MVDAGFNPTDFTAVAGKITFDGDGNYTMAATSVDNGVSNGAPQAVNLSGTYAIGSNGIGYLVNELYPTGPSAPFAYINGAVAQGVFTGSSTESQGDGNTLNDIFIAIPVGAAPTNASFTAAAYQTGLIDFQGANSAAIMNALFELSPDGKGAFGAIDLNGQASNSTAATVQQTVTGATYNFNSDGSATLTIPLPSGVSAGNALFTGTKTIFESADGKFILGWTAGGFDIFFGVKALTITGSNSISKGVYFTSALEDNPSISGTDSYYGAMSNNGDSMGDGAIHERINVPQPGLLAYDYGVDDQTMVNPDGTTGVDLNGYQYILGDGGQGVCRYRDTGILFAGGGNACAGVFRDRGFYLNPIGVNNAASFQPVTASIAPGELLALYGTNLASGSQTMHGGQAFPTSLGGVSVTINGIACPIFYVSTGQLSVIVPYEVASNQTGLANIQVTNGSAKSNVVQVYLTDAAPGAFSQGQNGIGLAAALHNATGALVTKDNPAEAGEYLSLYMTGLGTVTPAITDGAVGPYPPLSWSDLYKAGYLTVQFDDYNTFGTARAAAPAALSTRGWCQRWTGCTRSTCRCRLTDWATETQSISSSSRTRPM